MIKLHNIQKRFGDVQVLRGVSLAVQAGEVAVLLGASGGGKSTLLRTINGLETFDDGEIEVAGIRLLPSLGHQRDIALNAIRRRCGMVFQQFHLFPHRSVIDNVTEAPIHVLGMKRSDAEARAETLLKRVGMEHKLRARPTTLSGGQQQRVAIARALAMQPDVILFDEPTSALDPQMTEEVVRVMADLANSGQTMIVVTHSIPFARQIAHTIHTLDQGRLAATEQLREVKQRPESTVTTTAAH